MLARGPRGQMFVHGKVFCSKVGHWQRIKRFRAFPQQDGETERWKGCQWLADQEAMGTFI